MVKEDFHDGASERRGLKTEEQRRILDGMRSLERQSGINPEHMWMQAVCCNKRKDTVMS